MSQQKEIERSKLYWLPPLVFVLILSVSIIGLTFFIENQFHTAGFITAAIMASIGFHLFSLGNTAYACAASLQNEELSEYGYYINQNGIYATFGAGGVFLASALWFLLEQNGEVSNFFWHVFWSDLFGVSPVLIERLHFAMLRLIILIGIAIFAVGFLNQSKYGNWFTIVLEDIDASPNHDTVIDRLLNRLNANRNNFEVGDWEEKAISIGNVDSLEVKLVEVDTLECVFPDEGYNIQASIKNSGDQQGVCRVECKSEGHVIDWIERVLPSDGEEIIEFSDNVPKRQNERTIRIELKR